MGIVKVNLRGKEEDQVHESPLVLAINDHLDDSADLEIADVDCELIKIKDQICSIPYDLYDLDSLKDVLSLDTWNSCLSEDERFSLAAYLPSIDQETFSRTMGELLNGEGLFFGSPLNVFFSGLKGGLYSPRVSQLREALQFIQRCHHHHTLRSYHEKMHQTFIEMGRAWEGCPPSTDVEERLRMWIKQKDPKPVCRVDLNALPVDEDGSAAVDQDISSPSLSKKMMNSTDGEARLATSNKKPKGVLKIRSKARILEPIGEIKSFSFDSSGKSRVKPRGVLKIKPRSDPRPGYDHVLGMADLPQREPDLPRLARDIAPRGDLHRGKLRRVGIHSKEEGSYLKHSPLTMGLNLNSSQTTAMHEDSGSFREEFGIHEHEVGENGAKILPMTYKRKKGPPKHSILKPLRPPRVRTADHKASLAKRRERKPMEETRPMKVKLKIWSSPDKQPLTSMGLTSEEILLRQS